MREHSTVICGLKNSVGEPDPHVFGPPGSEVRLKMMCLRASYMKKIRKNIFFCILKTRVVNVITTPRNYA
jgi:hypothetical protein